MTGQGITAGQRVATGLASATWDAAAFEAFYNAIAPALRAYVCRVSGNPSTADDVLQEAFYRFLRNCPERLSEAQSRSYLYRAATSIIYDQWRRARFVEQAHKPAVVVMPDPSARIDMSRALGELSPRERALVWLAYVEGSTHAEIGAALGLSVLSVRVLLFRARGKLARILRREGPAEEVR